MNLSKTQLVIVAAAGAIILILALVFLGILPGLQSPATNPTKVKANLNFWGVNDTAENYADALAAFKVVYPNVMINYRGFNNPDEYESAILDALASGQGPDIFMIRNTDLPKNLNKISPVSPTQFPLVQFKQSFPQVVARDFVYQDNVYGLPLSVDTLALIYNRDLFDRAAVPLPSSWKNWDDFLNVIPKFVKRDSNNQITRAAAAIGGSAENIGNADDILYLLMLQSGTQLSDSQSGSISFASDAGAQALDFYSQFSNPSSGAYTWNKSMPSSLDAFGQGKVAMIFDYASALPKIKSRNSFINAEVAPILQPKDAPGFVSYPDYWGYVVSRQSMYQNPAWGFILTMTVNDSVAKNYFQKTQKPPALNSLIYQYQNDPVFGTFVRQALTARSWLQIDRKIIDQAVSGMLESIASGELQPTKGALGQIQIQINQSLRQKSL